MSRKNDKELASQILTHVGGKENVNRVYHCQTRLRFTLADESREEAFFHRAGVLYFSCIRLTNSRTMVRISSLWVHNTQEMVFLQSKGVHANSGL